MIRYLGRSASEQGDVKHWFGSGGEPYVLDAMQIQQQGLVDLVREGAQESPPRTFDPDATATATPASVPAEGSVREIDGWRVELFELDGLPHVSLSNRPKLDAAYHSGSVVPELQQAAVPLDVLMQAIAL